MQRKTINKKSNEVEIDEENSEAMSFSEPLTFNCPICGRAIILQSDNITPDSIYCKDCLPIILKEREENKVKEEKEMKKMKKKGHGNSSVLLSHQENEPRGYIGIDNFTEYLAGLEQVDIDKINEEYTDEEKGYDFDTDDDAVSEYVLSREERPNLIDYGILKCCLGCGEKLFQLIQLMNGTYELICIECGEICAKF